MINATTRTDNRYKNGSVLVGVLILAIAFTIIGIALTGFAASQYSLTSRNVYNTNALLMAEAGVEQAIHELNLDDNFEGHLTEQVLFNDVVQGRGVYVTSVENSPTGNNKIIISTGRVYRYNKTTDPVGTRKVKVTGVGTMSTGYSVYTGPGGLILGGNAAITNSDIYVNGTLTLNGASQIGTDSQPVNVHVAHISCPPGVNPGPTYPQVCTTGEPITMDWATRIYGSVCATNQVSIGPNSNIRTGIGGLGLVAGCIAPPVSSPTYNRVAHIAAVTTTDVGNSNTYTCQSPPPSRSWPANLRLNGDVTLDGNCRVTINGNAYVTGNLALDGSSRITVSDSVGTTRPVVIVDGTVTTAGSPEVVPNSFGTSVEFISFKSSAPCGPDCVTITGSDLKTSQDLLTIDLAGATNLPGVMFHAYWGKLRLDGSGTIGSAAGQTIDMTGAGTITFGTGLSSGTHTWMITSYQQLFGD